MAMFNTAIALTTMLTVVALGQNDDGTNNYLLHFRLKNEYDLSYSTKKSLPFKEGQSFLAKIKADCEIYDAMDEELTNKLNQWMPYKAWLCDITQLEVIK